MVLGVQIELAKTNLWVLDNNKPSFGAASFMRSIEARFKEMQKLYPHVGDYVALHRAVKHQRFSKKSIATWFKKLIPKEDYLPSHTEGLIEQLWKYSNSAEDGS